MCKSQGKIRKPTQGLVSKPRGREDYGGGNGLHHLRGYSELLGTILVGGELKEHVFVFFFFCGLFGTKILLPPRRQQHVTKLSNV